MLLLLFIVNDPQVWQHSSIFLGVGGHLHTLEMVGYGYGYDYEADARIIISDYLIPIPHSCLPDHNHHVKANPINPLPVILITQPNLGVKYSKCWRGVGRLI